MSGVVPVGIGYAEMEACYRFHGITDPDEQDLLLEAFCAISGARAEGRAAGEKQREKERKGSR